MSVLDDHKRLFLTVEELAPILRCSVYLVRKGAHSGDIPGAVSHAGRWIFRRADIEAWLGIDLSYLDEAS